MDSVSTDGRSRYLGETWQRMASAIRDLKAMQRSGAGSMNGVLHQLRQQQAACRRQGFSAMAHLCQTLEDCLTLDSLLTSVSEKTRPLAASLVAAVLDGCRVIQLHAEAVDKTASYLRRRDDAGRLSPSFRKPLSNPPSPHA